MTDKEMLKLAAKAAVIEYGWQHIFDDYEGSTSEKWDWNPLTDDGDALRLAVKLEMRTDVSKVATAVYLSDGDAVVQFSDDTHGDPYASTRRAIVRAAAEIGKGITQ